MGGGMMRVLRSKKYVVLLAGLITAASVAAIAIAAVTSQQVITDTTNMHLRVVRSVADGFDTGWHVHPGLAVVQVQEGSIQIYENGCTPKTVGAGDTFIEVPYKPVRAIGTGHVAWTTTFVLNGPDPFQIPLSRYSPGANPCPTLP
jgi:NaMN:DMB phosphoribosyltransferase